AHASKGLSQTVRTILVACDNQGLIDAIDTANNEGGAHILKLDQNCTYSYGEHAAPSAKDAPQSIPFWYGPTALPLITSDITIQGNGAKIRRITFNNPNKFRLF